MTKLNWLTAVSVAWLGLGTLGAAPVEFTLDPSKSTITVSGTVVGNTVSEQGAGSLTTKVEGKILVELAEPFVQFPGGSKLVLQDSGTWSPAVGGASGSAPANFGAKATLLFLTGYAALRNAQLDVTSAPLNIAGGNFDSSSLVFGFLPDAHTAFDYSVPLKGTGSISMTGLSTNHITTQSSIVSVAEMQTLTIPVDTDFYMGLVTDNDSRLTIKGQLVATRAAAVVPTSFSLRPIAVKGSTVTLQWQDTAGLTFQIWGSPDLKTWTSRATGVTSTTGEYSWSGSTSGAVEFLRVSK